MAPLHNILEYLYSTKETLLISAYHFKIQYLVSPIYVTDFGNPSLPSCPPYILPFPYVTRKENFLSDDIWLTEMKKIYFFNLKKINTQTVLTVMIVTILFNSLEKWKMICDTEKYFNIYMY